MVNSPAKARILTSYYRPKPGGFCRRLFQTIEALLADGHTVHYLSVVPFPIQHPQCVHHRFPWPVSKTRGLWFWGVFHLIAPFILLYLAIRYRINYSFAFGHTYGLLLQLTRIVRRVPICVFLRADVIETHRLMNYPKWLIGLDGFLEGLALHGTRTYCVSDTLAQRVRRSRRFSRPRVITVLPNALPKLATVTFGSRPTTLPLRFTSAGILEERKNLAMLIEIMAAFRPDQAHLNIYGVGPLEKQLADLVKTLGTEKQISFRGWSDDIQAIWNSSDLLLFPSRHEGSPNVVLEALAAGIAVLASDIPEHREILPQSSLLPLDDIQRWVEKLKQIVAEPVPRLATLRNQQRERAARFCFDWGKTMVDAVLETNTQAQRNEQC